MNYGTFIVVIVLNFLKFNLKTHKHLVNFKTYERLHKTTAPGFGAFCAGTLINRRSELTTVFHENQLSKKGYRLSLSTYYVKPSKISKLVDTKRSLREKKGNKELLG